MAKGKRSGHRAEDVIASHAMQHHDFIGGAEPERKEAERVKREHVEEAEQKLDSEVVREMAREFEEQAGLRTAHEAPAGERKDPGERKVAGRSKGLIERGLGLAAAVREELPDLLESLRHKAEERLAGLPPSVRRVVHRGEQAAALLLAPARIGFALARELLKAPLHLVGNLRRRAA